MLFEDSVKVSAFRVLSTYWREARLEIVVEVMSLVQVSKGKVNKWD